jgi:hypothetical protein
MDVEGRRLGLWSILATLLTAAAGVTAGVWHGLLAALVALAACVVVCSLAMTYEPVRNLVGITTTSAARQRRMWLWRPWTPFHKPDHYADTPAVALGLSLGGRFNLDRFNRERRPIRTTCTVRNAHGQTWRGGREHTGFIHGSEIPRPSLLLSWPHDFTPGQTAQPGGTYSVEWLIEYRGRAHLRYDDFRLDEAGHLTDR